MNDHRDDNDVHLEIPDSIPPDSRDRILRRKPLAWWQGSWYFPVAAAAFTVLWGLLIYSLIGNRPTVWQYGVVPFVPAESFLSSQEPDGTKAPKQVILPIKPGRPR